MEDMLSAARQRVVELQRSMGIDEEAAARKDHAPPSAVNLYQSTARPGWENDLDTRDGLFCTSFALIAGGLRFKSLALGAAGTGLLAFVVVDSRRLGFHSAYRK